MTIPPSVPLLEPLSAPPSRAAGRPPRRAVRRRIGAIAAGLLLSALAPGPAGAQQGTDGAGTAPPRQRSGTGFVVAPDGRLLTNAHVVADCVRIDVSLADGRRASGRVAVRDTRADLALIEGLGPAAAVAGFGPAEARAGDDVIALGYPLRGLLAMEANVSRGIVSATAGLRDDPTRLQISAPIQPGHSGGPLLDESGAVVGVVVSKLNALRVARMTGDVPQNVNFAIKASVAQAFLRANGVEPAQAAPPGPRLRTADVVQRARAFTVLVECATQAGERTAAGATGVPPATPAPATPPASAAPSVSVAPSASAAPAVSVAPSVASAPPPAAVAPASEPLSASPSLSSSSSPALAPSADPTRAPRFDLPVRCAIGQECAALDFFDHGEQRDFACGSRSVPRSVYTRFTLLGEHLARRDVAIVAAADGRVVARGESGLTVDHGAGWRTVYRFDTTTGDVPVGRTVSRGEALGRVTAFRWGTSNAALMGFAVVRDGRALDPFRPDPSGACGASSDARWTPEALTALGYLATGVLDAGFAAKDLDAAGLQAGDLPPVTRESAHLSFWVRRVGVRPGDRELLRVLDPDGRPIARHEFVAEATRAAGLLQIARRAPPSAWAPGTYQASYTLTRDGTPLVSTTRELTVR